MRRIKKKNEQTNIFINPIYLKRQPIIIVFVAQDESHRPSAVLKTEKMKSRSARKDNK